MRDETVTRTVVCKLATSNRKNKRVKSVIEEWQEMASRMAELMPSIHPGHWGAQDTTLRHVVKREFPDDERTIYAKDRDEAAFKVGEAFKSWRQNGRGGGNPKGMFGDGAYYRAYHEHIEVVENDRGWGLKVKLAPRTDPEWFRIIDGAYQREYLEAVTDGEASTGSAELHLKDDGSLFCHLTVKRDIEVVEPEDVDTWVGVDLGENVLFAAAVVNGSGVQAVEMEPGREFRHHRERMKRKKDKFQSKSRLREAINQQYRNYTDHVTHEAARRIVDLAIKHEAGGVRVENLTGWRERAARDDKDYIHDWPHHDLREKISNKAEEVGLAFEPVEPAYTSVTCRKCGHEEKANRDEIDKTDFECLRCGYEVHADVNAAINIAAGGVPN